MPNYRVSWGIGCALEVLADGSVDVQIDDDRYAGLVTREDARHLMNALLRAHQEPPRRFCPDCRSSAVTPARETVYEDGPGSECRGCGWKGPTRELTEA